MNEENFHWINNWDELIELLGHNLKISESIELVGLLRGPNKKTVESICFTKIIPADAGAYQDRQKRAAVMLWGKKDEQEIIEGDHLSPEAIKSFAKQLKREQQ